LNLFKLARGKFVADKDEIRPQFQDTQTNGSAVFASSLVRSIGPSIQSTIDQLDLVTINEAASDKELATPWYSDQVLPFDIRLGLSLLPNIKLSRAHAGAVAPRPAASCSGQLQGPAR
jgi:hypothetical protein